MVAAARPINLQNWWNGSMQRNILTALLILAAGSCLAAEQLDLVENGEPVYAVVVPDGKPQLAMEAARVFVRIVQRASDAKLPILEETAAPAGPKVFIGLTQAAEKAGLGIDKLKGQSCVLKAIDGNLFLAGNDLVRPTKTPRPYWTVPASRRAVQIFLREYLGARWLWPNRKGLGTHVPRNETPNFPADLDLRWEPTFPWIANSSFRQGEGYNLNTHFKASIPFATYGGHSYYSAVPKDTYGKTNPTYFALISGTRNSSQNHLCISNQAVQELLYKEMLKKLDEGFEAVELAQTDGYIPCECAPCQAIHPDVGEKLWIVHDKLAKRLAKERPEAKVIIIAYSITAEPPQTIERFGKNVIIELCSYTPTNMAAWQKKADAFMVYTYNWGYYHTIGFGPKTTPEMAARQIRFFRDNSIKAIYVCGNGESWGLEGPVYYIWNRLVDDPDCDWEAELDDYYRSAFGDAYVPMRAFYAALHDRLKLYGGIGRWGDQLPGAKSVGLARRPEDHYTYFFPPTLLKALGGYLARAKELEPEGVVSKRLGLVERNFQCVSDVATVFHLYRAYQLRPNWNSFDALADAIKQRDARVRSFFEVGGKLAEIDGFPAMFARQGVKGALVGGRMTGTLSSPFFWDVDLLREKRVLPGVSTRKLRITRATAPIKADGRLDEAVWQTTQADSLGEIGMGKVTVKTQVRMVYDDKDLYLGIVCNEPLIDRLASDWWKSHGRDGKVYTQDSLEIFLDPVGDLRQYYHLICSAIPDSKYDAAFGLQQDPIHPLYNKSDLDWNGEWTSKGTIDQQAKRWSVEVVIPFESLGVSAPSKGSIWKMNLGRERFVQNAHRGDPELYMWSPNLEERSFHSLAAFGDLVFE